MVTRGICRLLLFIPVLVYSQENVPAEKVFKKGSHIITYNANYGQIQVKKNSYIDSLDRNEGHLGTQLALTYEFIFLEDLSFGLKGNIAFTQFDDVRSTNGIVFMNWHFFNRGKIDLFVGADYGIGFFRMKEYWYYNEGSYAEISKYEGYNYGLHTQFRYFHKERLGYQFNIEYTGSVLGDKSLKPYKTDVKLYQLFLGAGIPVKF